MTDINGTNKADILRGSFESDNIYGFSRNDALYGRAGDDYLSGGVGKDTLFGGAGDDQLLGDADSDLLIGGSGDDDLMIVGKDTLIGGGGSDDFYLARDGRFMISDFESGSDLLVLNQTFDIPSGGGYGSSTDFLFVLGSGSPVANTRLIFSPRDGALLYDPDGSGSSKARIIGNIISDEILTTDDFT